MVTEPTLFTDKQGVRITPTRAIFDSTTYSIANITSIKRDVHPANRTAGIIIALVGLILFLLWIPWIGLPVLIIGIIIAAMAKSTYYLKITSASGEAEPISSKDKQYIDDIVDAINEALIRRG